LQANAGAAMPIEDLAVKAEAPDRVEMVYKILRHLAVNHPTIEIQGDLGQPGKLTASMVG
jgi:glucose-6-phosphate isomerase